MTVIEPLDLRRVPILPFTVAVVSGVILALHVAVSPKLFFIAALGTAAYCIIAFTLLRSRWLAISGLCVFLLVLSAYRGTRTIDRDARQRISIIAQTEAPIAIAGRVAAKSDFSHSHAVCLSPVVVFEDSTVVLSSAHCIRVYADSAVIVRLRYGDMATVKGRMVPAISAARGSTGTLIAALTRNELATVIADSASLFTTEANGFRLRRSIDRLRDFIRDTFNNRLNPDAAALCRALVLGDREGFSDVFTERLRLTGLSHVFALSGVNVGIVITVIWAFLGLLFVPRTFRLLIILGVALFYMELGREAPSLVRATLMAVFFILGALLYRHGSVYNNVVSAAFVEVLWRPLDIIDAGFLLSYLAVFGILAGIQILRPYLLKRWSQRRWSMIGVDVAGSTVSAQVATIPLVAYVFQRIPFLGVVGNLIAIPLFAVMLVWSLLLLVIEALLPALGTIIAQALNAISYCAGALVNTIAELPLAAVAIPHFSPVLLILLYAMLAYAVIALAAGSRKYALIALLIAGNVLVWNPIFFQPDKTCRLTFLNVGEGDAALVATSGGRHVLIDTGPRYAAWSAADAHSARAFGAADCAFGCTHFNAC